MRKYIGWLLLCVVAPLWAEEDMPRSVEVVYSDNGEVTYRTRAKRQKTPRGLCVSVVTLPGIGGTRFLFDISVGGVYLTNLSSVYLIAGNAAWDLLRFAYDVQGETRQGYLDVSFTLNSEHAHELFEFMQTYEDREFDLGFKEPGQADYAISAKQQTELMEMFTYTLISKEL